MTDLRGILATAITPALQLLPAEMRNDRARVMLLAIGLQESRFEHRRQIKGPARGFWQFELGTALTRGGVWGVCLHERSRVFAFELCKARSCKFDPPEIYAKLEHDDVLAAGIARLLLWTDPLPLPRAHEADVAWQLYLRTWRPGKPHPETWARLFAVAGGVVS